MHLTQCSIFGNYTYEEMAAEIPFSHPFFTGVSIQGYISRNGRVLTLREVNSGNFEYSREGESILWSDKDGKLAKG